MPNKYESLWKPPSPTLEEDGFDMPWRENLDDPKWGDREYHVSGQLIEMQQAAREIVTILQYLSPESQEAAINAWIETREDDSGFCDAMNELLKQRDVYRLMCFWQERTSPFFFLAEAGFFKSRQQYEGFLQKAYAEIGAEYREFDELASDEGKEPLREDWITFVR